MSTVMSSTRTLSAISLLLLTVQNSALSLTITKSRQQGASYNPAVAVFLCEVSKIVVCLIILIIGKTTTSRNTAEEELPMMMSEKEPQTTTKHSRSISEALRELYDEVIGWDCVRLLVPAFIYVAQNNLQFVAATHLSPTSYQIFSQLKIATTALFSVILLNKSLSMQKSVSILQLMGGIMFFQYSVMRATPHTATATSADVKAHSAQSPLLGMAAMILSCLVSGFAGVYTEKIVKKAKTSVWTSNLQLALCSLGPASFPIIASYIRSTGSEFNLFQGFTSWTWFVVALNLCGGLLVGMTVKYANSILKSFATSFALILTFLFSFAFLDASFSYLSALSVLIVVSAIVVYSRPEAAKSYSTEVSPLSSPILEVTDLFDVVTSKDHRAISIQ